MPDCCQSISFWDTENSSSQIDVQLISQSSKAIWIKFYAMEVKDVNLSLSTPWGHVRGVEVELHLFFALVLDWSERSSSCPGYFKPLEKTPVPTELEVEWAPEWVWSFGEDENLLPLTGFEPQIVQSVTVSAPITLIRILKYFFPKGNVFSLLLLEGVCYNRE